MKIWCFPKIGGTVLGVHIIRNIIIEDVFRGPLLRATKIGDFSFMVLQGLGHL